MNKSDLRAEALRVRANLRVHADDAERAAAHFMEQIAPKSGAVVAAYFPIKFELDTLPLLDALHSAGCIVALPVIGEILTFRRWHPDMNLVSGAFNIPVPPDRAETVIPDIIVAPVLAFDRRGTRLGMGGGYYDCTIAHLRAQGPVQVVGYAYAEQICLFPLPRAEHDVPLDGVITPLGIQRF